MSKVAHYRHVYYTLALTYAKNHVTIFGSFLDSGENAECPRLIWSTLYTVDPDPKLSFHFRHHREGALRLCSTVK